MRLQLFFLISLFYTSLPIIVQDPKTCLSNQYFNSPKLECSVCPDNSEKSTDGNSCVCKNRYKTVYDSIKGTISCQACPGGQLTFLPDITKCYSLGVGVQDTNGVPTCSAGNQIPYLNSADQIECRSCPYGEYAVAGVTSGKCIKCPHPKQTYINVGGTWKCSCQNSVNYKDIDGSTTCVLSNDTAKLTELVPDVYISYKQIERSGTSSFSSAKVKSNYFSNYYKDAYVYCLLYLDITACQSLANMCIMNMYAPDSTMCRVYNSIKDNLPVVKDQGYSDSGWRQGFPWIFYSETGDSVRLSSRLNFRVSFDVNSPTTKRKLEIWMAKYYSNGTYIGLELLQPSFFLCPRMTLDDISTFEEFGANTKHECQFDLKEALDTPDTYFYELFIKDSNGKLVDLPVLVLNYVSGGQQEPNWNEDSPQLYNYVRRFSMLDVTSTYKDYTNINDVYIRYVHEIKLEIILHPSEPERIYLPVVRIAYRERPLNMILNEDRVASSWLVTEYIMDISGFINTAKGFLITLNILALIIVIYRFYNWTKTNPQLLYRGNYTTYSLGQLLYYLFDTWVTIFFWFLVGISCYWFIFYKLESRAYVLLPKHKWMGYYRDFDILFGLLASAKLIVMLLKMGAQTTYDVFFIDWEKPKKDPKNPKNTDNINVWRSLFTANELNELQNTPLVTVEFTYFVYMFFMFGLGWYYWASETPILTTSGNDSPFNRVLYFFVMTFVFLCTGAAEYFIKMALSIWLPLPSHDFIDLCAVSNMSIIMFDEILHGYYIHGQSPGGMADTDSEELKRILENEERGGGRNRGLDPSDSSGLQTYEIYIPGDMRRKYDGLYSVPLELEIEQLQRSGAPGAIGKVPGFNPTVPQGLDIDVMEQRRRELSKALKVYIEQIVANSSRYIQDKTAFQRFLGLPPADMSTLKGFSYFFRDTRMSFQQLFLPGMDFHFIEFRILVFFFWQAVIGNQYFAIVFTYLIEITLIWFRSVLASRNLSTKTMIDQRFLI